MTRPGPARPTTPITAPSTARYVRPCRAGAAARARQAWVGLLLGGWLSLGLAAAPATAPAAAATLASRAKPPAPDNAGSPFDGSRFDALLLLAEESPRRARAALADSSAAGGAPCTTPACRRQAALLQAWVATRLGEPDALPPGTLEALAAAGAALAPGLTDADTALLQALQAERSGRLAVEGLAQLALASYDAYCGAQAPVQADCEHRTRWQAHQLLAQYAADQHSAGVAQAHGQAALALAAAGRDRRRQAWSESQLALAQADTRDQVRAANHLERARALAGRRADTTLLQRLAYTEAALAGARGDAPRARAALQRMGMLAHASGSTRQQAIALANLSDHAVKSGQPAAALQHARQGLAALGVGPPGPVRNALLHNAVLARTALGHVAEARRDFEVLQSVWAEAGANGRQLTSLREFSDALATAGDLKGALEMHHRERALADRLIAANRDAALAELRSRFDREAQQRRILLLERDNALTTAAVSNQQLNQRLWATAGGVLALAAVLMLLLVRRVRETRRKLESNQARLRVQSERDALTGATSRRHAQALMRAAGAEPGGFAGALLMIDIDHFKQINDSHGHAVGDQVLAEVARRIASAVRPQDMVARWGGEEFLVHAPGLTPSDANVLARQLLLAVSGTPVALAQSRPPAAALTPAHPAADLLPGAGPTGAGSDAPSGLRATVSIGHAVFPLPPGRVPLSPEQAINLADMALYTAKGQGRHRAVGIISCTADRPDALRAVESDFERAWQDDRVRLQTDTGPGPTLDGRPVGAH